jgi:outer membrane protein
MPYVTSQGKTLPTAHLVAPFTAVCVLLAALIVSQTALAGDSVAVVTLVPAVFPRVEAPQHAAVAQEQGSATPSTNPPDFLGDLDDDYWSPFSINLDKILLPTDYQDLVDYLAEGYTAQAAELTLADALELALVHNPGMNESRLNAAAAAKDSAVQRSALFPQLSLSAGSSWTNSDAGSGSPTTTQSVTRNHSTGQTATGSADNENAVLSLSLSLSQKIYDFGRTNNLIDVSRAQAAAQAYTTALKEQQLVNSVSTSYYRFSAALGQARLARDELQLAEESLSHTQARYEVGSVPKLDVMRAQSRVEAARESVISASSQLGDASADFYALLGMEDKRYVPMVLAAAEIDPASELPSLGDAIAQALACRPELTMQYEMLKASRFNVKLAGNKPVLQAYSSTLYQDSGGASSTHSYEYGLQLTWNLFNGGQDFHAREKARLELKALEDGLIDLEASIELKVTKAWNRAVAAQASIPAAERKLEVEKEALRTASLGYAAGVIPYLDFSTALNSEVSAALGYLGKLIEARLALADLELAMGYPEGYSGLLGTR